ncbi:hypothetical protein BRC82_02425 [Halobacteriales archaeon QS_1_67_19]|nr:MAG: hypothetical protein BRC82_02425 [Halobacteriales archaeon QS_1_67_19]
MNPIDDKGRLFGTINIIDLLAVLLVLGVVAAGAAFVLGADDQSITNQQQTTVTYQITGVQPYVADAIPEGPVRTDAIAAVENKTVRPTEVVVQDDAGELHERPHPRKKTVTLRLTLNTTQTDDDIQFEDEPLEVGRDLTLDFGPVTVNGNVTVLNT